MKRRKFFASLVMALIAMGILLIGTDAMALDDCNQIWTTGVNANKFTVPASSGTYSFSTTPYKFKFLGVNPVTCINGDCEVGKKIYKWSYGFKNQQCESVVDPAPISNVQFMVPSPIVNSQNIYYCGDPPKFCTPSPSDPTTGVSNFSNKYFGFALWQMQTIHTTQDGSAGQYYFYTKTPASVVPTSIYYIGGNNEFFAATLGPGTPEQDFIPFNQEETKVFGEVLVKIYRDRGTWCANTVEYSTDGGSNWTQVTPEVPQPGTINSCGAVDGNQRCQECVEYTENSPGCYRYISGGRTYYFCSGVP